MESHQIQFILKSMLGISLAAIITVASLIPSAYSSPIQNANENIFQPIHQAASIQQNQYQQQPQQQAFVEVGSNSNVKRQQIVQDEIYKTYNPNFVTNYQQLTKNGAEIINIRPTRRTILSTLMAPFLSMRESAMNMLGATLQGCNSGSQTSMWCRFWGMFLK